MMQMSAFQPDAWQLPALLALIGIADFELIMLLPLERADMRPVIERADMQLLLGQTTTGE